MDQLVAPEAGGDLMPEDATNPKGTAKQRRRSAELVNLPRWASILTAVLGSVIAILWLARLLWSPAVQTPLAARSILLIADVPNVAALVSDTPAVRALQEGGVLHLLMSTPTISGNAAGRDLAVASGADIFRLFRMESILNIWLWEQIENKPIRPEATYIFTDRFEVYESLLSTLRARFGEINVRPFEDDMHRFSGEVPGNYIIEALVPLSEVRGIALDFDEGWREWLRQYGFQTIFRVRSTEDIDVIRKGEAIYIEDDALAAYAFRKFEPGEVFLNSGIRNPGWTRSRSVSTLERWIGEQEPTAAVVISPDQLTEAQSAILARGYDPKHRRDVNQEKRLPALLRSDRVVKSAAVLVFLWLVFLAFPRSANSFSLFEWKEREIRWVMILTILVIALHAELLFTTAWNVAIVLFAVFLAERRYQMTSVDQFLFWWTFGGAIVLAGGYLSLGNERFTAVAAFGFFLAVAHRAGRHGVFYLALALLAIPLAESAPAVAGIFIGAAALSPLLSGREISSGLLLLTLPTGLLLLAPRAGNSWTSMLLFLSASAVFGGATYYAAGVKNRSARSYS